jgi:hypothetical protein
MARSHRRDGALSASILRIDEMEALYIRRLRLASGAGMIKEESLILLRVKRLAKQRAVGRWEFLDRIGEALKVDRRPVVVRDRAGKIRRLDRRNSPPKRDDDQIIAIESKREAIIRHLAEHEIDIDSVLA